MTSLATHAAILRRRSTFAIVLVSSILPHFLIGMFGRVAPRSFSDFDYQETQAADFLFLTLRHVMVADAHPGQ